MHYDVAIIGAGMSGLAAGIRLAHFDRSVCIFERHGVCGGLNSFYIRNGRRFDVGLHALTNYTPPQIRSAPLSKLLRQLRLDRRQFDLCPQLGSQIRFPGVRLRFTNDLDVLTQGVAEEFPKQIDGFCRLLETVRTFDHLRLDAVRQSARKVLAEMLTDRLLIEMLLCPLMYYGNAEEHDMDFTQFVTMFQSIFCEGFARPRDGVRAILKALVGRFRECGGGLRMNCGVERLVSDGSRVTGLELESAEQVTADVVLSSAGYCETMQRCSDACDPRSAEETGRLSFVESITVTDTPPAELGLKTTIVFYNDTETFTYARPETLVDTRSGVVCCPDNFERHQGMSEGMVRLTALANFDRWAELDEPAYARCKRQCFDEMVTHAVRLGVVPDFRDRAVCTDLFTPRTIRKYTGHINGAVYGTPEKRRDGRTRLKNLFICGTDQGFLGIIGAMLSGITIANLHVLSDG